MEVAEYLQVEIENGVATIWLDQKNEKINKVSSDLVACFEEVLDPLKNNSEVKAIVMMSRKKDFIAGADIEMFKKVQKPGDFKPLSKQGHEYLNKIANFSKPIVAAIHGNCLGAGLEIAMACHVRIAANDKATKVALPEVKLGLLPGAGGTQRLPRLVGIQKALDMMMTGKNVYSSKAFKMGLIDRLAGPDVLHKAAKDFALELTKKKFKRKDKRKLMEKLLEGNPITRGIIFKKARQMVMGMTKGNYPAPLRILDCVEAGYKGGMTAGLAAEVEHFESLVLSNESRQLINIFFAMTDKKKNPYSGQEKKVNELAMVGAGFMGAGIAEVSITDGIEVILKDIKEETLASAKKTIHDNFSKRLKKKAMTQMEYEKNMSRLHSKMDYEGFDNVDIVVEAVFEEVNLKRRVLAECEAATPDHCIFATNTSALPIADVASESKRPEQVIGMHYFSPVPKMPLLEIIITDKTADWVTASCYDLGVRQGKTCIVVKDGPGFYTTRILCPMMNETNLVLEEGGDILKIDKYLKEFGYPVGPVTLMDEVGIDVAAHINKGSLMDYIKSRPGLKVSDKMIVLADAGYYGRKNHKGFYQYDAKTGKKIKKVDPNIYDFFGGPNRKDFDKTELQHRIAFMMVNEAALCLQEGIISNPLDGDIGAVFGLGFPPFRGGPFRHMDTIGATETLRIMDGLAEKFGERFAAAQIIRDQEKAGKRFYD